MTKITMLLFLHVCAFCINVYAGGRLKINSFEIAGSAAGFKDSTMLFLDDITTSSFIDIDSALIIHGKFNFRGSLKQDVLHVAVRTRDFSDRKYFWLENTKIIFSGEKGSFRQASIKGSDTQLQQDILDASAGPANDEKKKDIAFINTHPNSVISAYLLEIYGAVWGKDTTTMLYNHLAANIKNSYYGAMVAEFISLNRNIQVGDPFADFAQPDISGKIVKLSDYKGKVILLEFWGSWCGPCRKGNPELVAIYREYKNRNFAILGVAAETDKKAWVEAIQQDSLSWANVSELKFDKNNAALIYGVSYYPTNFLIDQDGKIIGRDLIGDQLRKKLTELLK